MSDLVLFPNAMSNRSEKVRLVLAEKGLACESPEVNLVSGEQHAPEHVKRNPVTCCRRSCTTGAC